MADKKKDPNRKTNIPVEGIPAIMAYLFENCTVAELQFMANLGQNSNNFKLLSGIFSRLTEWNIYMLFYEKNIHDPVDLMVYRAGKRGEVAGLKAFQAACKGAAEILKKRGEENE